VQAIGFERSIQRSRRQISVSRGKVKPVQVCSLGHYRDAGQHHEGKQDCRFHNGTFVLKKRVRNWNILQTLFFLEAQSEMASLLL
jgi:hypothetical protein